MAPPPRHTSRLMRASRAFAAALLALGAAVAGCGSSSGSAGLQTSALMDPATCQTCHPAQYQQWAQSMHAYATDDPVFRAMNARAQRESNGALGTFCVNCHAPVAVRDAADRRDQSGRSPRVGEGCDLLLLSLGHGRDGHAQQPAEAGHERRPLRPVQRSGARLAAQRFLLALPGRHHARVRRGLRELPRHRQPAGRPRRADVRRMASHVAVAAAQRRELRAVPHGGQQRTGVGDQPRQAPPRARPCLPGGGFGRRRRDGRCGRRRRADCAAGSGPGAAGHGAARDAVRESRHAAAAVDDRQHRRVRPRLAQRRHAGSTRLGRADRVPGGPGHLRQRQPRVGRRVPQRAAAGRSLAGPGPVVDPRLHLRRRRQSADDVLAGAEAGPQQPATRPA